MDIESLYKSLAVKDSEIEKLRKRNAELEKENQELREKYEKEKKAREAAEKKLLELEFEKLQRDDYDFELDEAASVATTVKYSVSDTIDYGGDHSPMQLSQEEIMSELAQAHEEKEKLQDQLLQTKAELRETIARPPKKPEPQFIERKYLSEKQLNGLIKLIKKTRSPKPGDIDDLASETGLENGKVRSWFSKIPKRVRGLMDDSAEESTKLRALMDLEKVKHDDIEKIFT